MRGKAPATHAMRNYECIYKPHTLLLAVLCLLLCFMPSNSLLQPKVVSSEMAVLHTLYNSTGGNIGAWNFTSIRNRLLKYNISEYDYYDPGLIGRDWSFARDGQGAYLEDPCPDVNLIVPPFMGVNCSCDAVSCYISAISVPLGNLSASTIPPALGDLTHLTFLELSQNAFRGRIPNELLKLTQLRILDLKQNKLTGSISAGFGGLPLTNLYLWGNSLNGTIPASLGNLSLLQGLDFGPNKLTGPIPASLGNCQQLTFLFLGANKLTSSIPASLGNLTQLKELHLWDNLLTSSIPASLGGLTQLSGLYLTDNLLTSSIPASLGKLRFLGDLYLRNNLLTGTIPASLGNLSMLSVLTLRNNALNGTIPAGLGDLKHLDSILLRNNRLTGTIPASLGKLSKLSFLSLYVNQLTGTIPPELGAARSLDFLLLNDNRLTGTIPPELGKLANLTTLYLQKNFFVSTIPSSFGRLTQLTHLDLSSNMLSGIVPPELANLVSINALLMHGNNLTGGSTSGQNAFGFINPAKQVNLTALDISSNAFGGPLSESLFALPKLEIFAAGSNCFSGALPSNLCDATKLRVLAIAGLSSGESCRRMYWKGAFFTRALGFNGFGADHFMQGSLPQCVFKLPVLRNLSVAGNSFLGQVPSLEGSVTNSLEQIDVSRNKLSGSITKEIASAMLTGGNLKTLNMSYNRISGDLSAFTYNTSVALSLEVNRLSGVIPDSLRSLRRINILAGNVFACSQDKAELPKTDTPAIDSYQCDSKPMNNMMYAFSASMCVLFVLWEMLYRRSSLRFHFRTMRTWLLVADGAGVTSQEFPFTNVSRYSRSMSEVRRFVCIVGLALLIVLIVYGALSSDKHRMLEHTYLWVTTAAYMTGSTSTGWLSIIGVFMTTLTCYLVTENVWRTKAADVARLEGSSSADHALSSKTQKSVSDSRWMRWRLRLLPILRLMVLIMVVWGVIAATNVWYLKILLLGTRSEQEIFKFAFAAFKLIWTLGITPAVFKSKFLLFGLQDTQHAAFSKFWLGGEVNVMLALNAVSTFGIPLLVIMVDKFDCFRDVFVAAAPIDVQFTINVCTTFYTGGACADRADIPFVSLIEVPFLYNYTCSSSMIRAYVPLYQQMVSMLITVSCAQVVYLCLDISALEQGKGAKPGRVRRFGAKLWGFIKSVVLLTMPTSELTYNSSQRLGGYKEGVVFASQPRVWITERLPAQFSNLLILVTFGVWAPLLGFAAIISIVLDTYVSQLVIGRFLVVELGVVQERKEELGLILPDSAQVNSELSFTPARRKNMHQDLQDCDEPWGAVAVLKEVEEQCTHWPASILAQGRTVLVVLPAITMAFLILDVINGDDVGDTGPTYWPCVFLVCYVCALEFLSRVYKRYFVDRSRQGKPKASLGADAEAISKGVDVGSVPMTDMSKSITAIPADSQSQPQSHPPAPPSDGIPTELDLGDMDFIPPASFDEEAVSPMHLTKL